MVPSPVPESVLTWKQFYSVCWGQSDCRALERSMASKMIPPIRIQKGNLPPLAHSVGSCVLCRYDGRDVPCVKTFQDLINLKCAGKYYGILQDQMKTTRFEIKKKIIATDGEMASYPIKYKTIAGPNRYLFSIASHEGTLCIDSDAFIVTERGERIKVYAVKFKYTQSNSLTTGDTFGVYMERGVKEQLPRGCPIYNKENKVIGLIKAKNYGILWFVKWFHESKLIENNYEHRDMAAFKDDEIPQYQCITNLTTPYTKECVSPGLGGTDLGKRSAFSSTRDLPSYNGDKNSEERVIYSDTIVYRSAPDLFNFAQPFKMDSGCKGPKGQADHSDKAPPERDVSMLRQEVDSLKRNVALLSKKLKCIESPSGNENNVEHQKAEQPQYASLYKSPVNDRKQVYHEREVADISIEHEFDENGSCSNITKTIGSFRRKKILIDGKFTKPGNATGHDNSLFGSSSSCSSPNDYIRFDEHHRPLPQNSQALEKDQAKKKVWDDFNQGMTINEIGQETLFELAIELDSKEWELLAAELGVSEEIIQQIKASQYGRGNAAIEFICNLITRFPKERLCDLREKLKTLMRNDVVDYIDSAFCQDLMNALQDIPHQKLATLASRLEQSQFKSIKYWRHLAGLYGYENPSISAIESNCGYHERSPTLALFEYMGKSEPTLSISQIGTTLEKLGMHRMSRKLHDVFSRGMTFSSSIQNLIMCEFPPL